MGIRVRLITAKSFVILGTMSIDAFYEKREDLLVLARQRGFTITTTQLVRWHRAGLLPRPRQLPLKGIRGTGSFYPEWYRRTINFALLVAYNRAPLFSSGLETMAGRLPG